MQQRPTDHVFGTQDFRSIFNVANYEKCSLIDSEYNLMGSDTQMVVIKYN